VLERQLQLLAAARVQILPMESMSRHLVLERDGFVILVERRDGGFGNVGSAGLLSDHGFAALVQRNDGFRFVARGFDQPATDEQIAALRLFENDVRNALRSELA
jgi:hypothetical protein